MRATRHDLDVIGDRLRHVVVDTAVLVVLLAVPALVTVVALALRPEPVPAAVPTLALTAAAAVVLLAVGVVWPHHDGGRTAGMRAARLRVVDRHGGTPSHGRLLLRGAVLPVDLVVGPALVAARSDRRRLGDLLAGTQVVRDPDALEPRAATPRTATPRTATPRTTAPARSPRRPAVAVR